MLAQADVSIAMLDGSRLAQASADVIFVGEDLRMLARLPQWADTTRRVVRQNLLWAAAYNAAAVPLAAFGHLAPWMAAIGMSLSSLLVIGNALRLGRILNADKRQSSPEPARQLRPSSAS
jgi:Cu2+-exporting ATPase